MTKHITKLSALLLLAGIATGCVVHTQPARVAHVTVRGR
jgi:hypothetical protein